MKQVSMVWLVLSGLALLTLIVGCGQKWVTHDIGDDCTAELEQVPPGSEFRPATCSHEGGYVLVCVNRFYQAFFDCGQDECVIIERHGIDPNTGKEALIEARPVCPGDEGLPVGVEGVFCAEARLQSRVCSLDRGRILTCSGGADAVWEVEQECSPGLCDVDLSGFEMIDDVFPQFQTKEVYCDAG
jgi:hypothetical protein